MRLAVRRQVVGVFRHDDVGDERFRRDAALDQPRRRGRLRHGVPAGAGVFGTAGDDHAKDRRDFVEAFGPLFADHVHGLAAAGVERVFRLDDLLDPLQGRGKSARFARRFFARSRFRPSSFLSSSAFALALSVSSSSRTKASWSSLKRSDLRPKRARRSTAMRPPVRRGGNRPGSCNNNTFLDRNARGEAMRGLGLIVA